jgi:hypothetical protein
MEVFMFIRESERTTLLFWCRFDGYKVKVFSEEAYKRLPEAKREGLKRYEIVFRPTTWGMQNAARRAAIFDNPETGMKDFDSGAYLAEKLVRGIVEWDLTRVEGGKDVPAPITREMVDKLHPKIAEYIINYYEAQNELTEAELKKL